MNRLHNTTDVLCGDYSFGTISLFGELPVLLWSDLWGASFLVGNWRGINVSKIMAISRDCLAGRLLISILNCHTVIQTQCPKATVSLPANRRPSLCLAQRVGSDLGNLLLPLHCFRVIGQSTHPCFVCQPAWTEILFWISSHVKAIYFPIWDSSKTFLLNEIHRWSWGFFREARVDWYSPLRWSRWMYYGTCGFSAAMRGMMWI